MRRMMRAAAFQSSGRVRGEFEDLVDVVGRDLYRIVPGEGYLYPVLCLSIARRDDIRLRLSKQ